MPTGVRYPAEFKAEAIRLFKSSRRPHREIAEQLGIAPESLRRWVMQADIAHRLGKSREYVRMLVSGERGRGHFPQPISHLRGRSRLWRWSDIAAWAGLLDEEERHRARYIAAMNAALELRRSGFVGEERDGLLAAASG